MRCTILVGETAALAGVTVKAVGFDMLEDKITVEITPGETLDEPRERMFGSR